MIDCGTDWRGCVHSIQPTFIVLTHGHPDQARGLADGAPCPVYATRQTDGLQMPLAAGSASAAGTPGRQHA
jgi:glyoxylase-like metal-dependent hydrolase (beta-lactamase superfamily II)